MACDSLQIVFVGTEVAGFSKVGGLGDVLAALPPALAARGHDVLTVAPRYETYEGVTPTGLSVPLDLPARLVARAPDAGPPEGGGSSGEDAGPPALLESTGQGVAPETEDEEEPTPPPAQPQPLQDHAQLHSCQRDGVQWVFVDHPIFLSSDIYGCSAGGGKSVYTYCEGNETSDLDLRYSILCQAALAAPVLLRGGERPGALANAQGQGQAPLPARPTVFVANDWPTSLLLLRLKYCLRRQLRPGAGGGDSGGPGAVAGADAGCGSDAAAQLEALLAEQLAQAVCVFCIHNLCYQGHFPASAFPRLCLPPAALPALCTSSDWEAVLAAASSSSSNVLEHSSLESVAPTAVAGGAGSHTMSGGSNRPTAAREGDDQRRWQWMHKLRQPEEGAGGAAPPLCESGVLSMLRAALLCSDALVTVSPGYAAEVASASSGMSCGLHAIIQAKGITGIMNGTDTREWDPSTDYHLPPEGRYDAGSVREGKARMKALLQARLGLAVSASTPLVGFVGRLTAQKGVDVLLGAAPMLLAGPRAPQPSRWQPADAGGAQPDGEQLAQSTGIAQRQQAAPETAAGAAGGAGLQLVLLGTGDGWMEVALDGLARSFPSQAVGLPAFSEEMAHWIMAACDFILVPSRFEPCGLVAQYALLYGAPPVVCAVGGLRDLVTPEVGHALPPFSKERNAANQRQDVVALVSAIRQATALYGSEAYRQIQQRCMAFDVSWEQPAAEWERLLLDVAARSGGAR